MNKGKYIFSQFIEFIPKYQFDKLVAKYKGDWHSKDLTCYNQFLHLLYGQLTGCDSIREICICLDAHKSSLYHLGISKTVNPSNLTRANENRDYRIYEELGEYLIGVVRPMYSSSAISDIPMDNMIYALDSTTISTSLKLAMWALGKYTKGAVKMHTLLDLRGSIPANIHITHGKWHDSNELDEITPEKAAFYIADKAYVDFEALYHFHKEGAFWVTRPKTNMKYECIDQIGGVNPSSEVISDMLIKLVGNKSKKLYPEPIRLVSYHDQISGEDIDFISNNLEINALDIANLYRHRWEIEVFFKWIKQNMTVKKLWGYSENAVKTHLWVAIIAYLTVARIKAVYNSPYSITEVASILRVSAMERASMRDLISNDQTNQNQIVNEPMLFDSL